MFLGDRNPGDVVHFKLNSIDTGNALITLSGGAIAVYKDANTTESTAGATLTSNFDTRTGLHHVTIDTSADGAFYSAGSDFFVILTAGTVDGVPQANMQIGHFSLQNRADKAFTRLGAPTGASVSADIAAVNAKTANLPSDPADESLVIAATDAIFNRLGAPAGASMSADIASLIGALISAASEPGQGAPAVNASRVTKIDYLYKAWRNKVTQDATTFKVFADDGSTVDHKATVSDDGTTFTRGEIASGP